MLEIKNLTKRYDETIIKNLNIILPSTGLIIIVGNSGCGKTTLLNLIGGIDQDYEGEIYLDDYLIIKIFEKLKSIVVGILVLFFRISI